MSENIENSRLRVVRDLLVCRITLLGVHFFSSLKQTTYYVYPNTLLHKCTNTTVAHTQSKHNQSRAQHFVRLCCRNSYVDFVYAVFVDYLSVVRLTLFSINKSEFFFLFSCQTIITEHGRSGNENHGILPFPYKFNLIFISQFSFTKC